MSISLNVRIKAMEEHIKTLNERLLTEEQVRAWIAEAEKRIEAKKKPGRPPKNVQS